MHTQTQHRGSYGCALWKKRGAASVRTHLAPIGVVESLTVPAEWCPGWESNPLTIASVTFMRRVIAISITILAFMTSTSNLASAAHPNKIYKNCTELRKAYPNGVAKSAKAAGTTSAFVNAKIYKENIKSDRDKDGIACER